MAQSKKWHNLESGQALMEYWPTIPAAIMIIISAGLIVSFLRGSFSQTADALNRVNDEICETDENEESGPGSTIVGDKLVELVGVNYDGTNTTVTYRVTEAVPEKGNNGVGNGEDGQPPGAPPVNDGAGTSPGNPGNKGGADKDTATEETTDYLVIQIPTVSQNNIIDGSGPWTPVDNGIQIGESDSKGNNGNNGNGDDKPKGNNGVGNGEDGQPPGEPPINDGEGTSPGNPGNKGGAKDKRKTMARQIMNIQLQITGGSSSINFIGGNSYEISILLSGEYQFKPVSVSTTQDGASSGTISAPAIVINEGTKDCND